MKHGARSNFCGLIVLLFLYFCMLIAVPFIRPFAQEGTQESAQENAQQEVSEVDVSNFEEKGVEEKMGSLEEGSSPGTAVKETKSELKRLEQTLQFGTDTAVIESLKTLSSMGLSTMAPAVLERMRGSTNEKVLIQAFTYLRDIQYADALEFAVSYVSDFGKQPSRAVQFAFFYIQDFVDSLSAEMKETLNNTLFRILQDDNPHLSLVALSLFPQYYSEKDEPYYGDAFFEEEPAVNVEVPIKNIPSDITTVENRLLSQKLINAYENTFTAAVQDEIISTLGKIGAYNALPFILDLVDDEKRLTQSRRSAIIIALGSFEISGDIFNTVRDRRLAVFEKARRDPSPKIRKALFEALHMHRSLEETETPTRSNFVPQWLFQGIRDDTLLVRKAVLRRIEALFEFFSEEERVLFFDAVLFLVNYDSSPEVRVQAVQVLSKFPQGKEHVLDTVKNMTTLNSVSSAYLSAVLQGYAEDGGVEALTTLVKNTIDESTQGRSFFSDALALMQEVAMVLSRQSAGTVPEIGNLVALMLQHPDTTVQKNMLAVIAKNTLVDFLEIVKDMSQDVAVPSAIRLQARQTAEVLQRQ